MSSEKKKGSVTPVVQTHNINWKAVAKKNLIKAKIIADDPMFVPQYKTEGAACCDLVANLPPNNASPNEYAPFVVEDNPPLVILPGETFKIDCGFRMQLPHGWEAQIRARSGLAAQGLMAQAAVNYIEEKNPYVEGLTITNWPGTIDSDYTGRIAVIVNNVGQNTITISHGQRFAQMALKPVWWFDWDSVTEFEETVRGDGGFGSTGA